MSKISNQLSAAKAMRQLHNGQIVPQQLKVQLLQLFPNCQSEIDELNDDGSLNTDRFSSLYGETRSYFEFFTEDSDLTEVEDRSTATMVEGVDVYAMMYTQILEIKVSLHTKKPQRTPSQLYVALMKNNPTEYDRMTNSLNQVIRLVEHPTLGDEAPVMCMCDELKLAAYSDFYETGDMMADHKEYEPIFIDGRFQHGL